MKKVCSSILLFSSLLLATGCEKTKECENYSPWPSAEAMSAWKDYSSEMLDNLDAYNDISTALSFFGRKPSYVHDSIVSMYNGDSVLLCGYLNLWKNYGLWNVYMVTDRFHEKPLDINQDDFITVYINNHREPLDTLKKAYIPALFKGNLLPEDINTGYCCKYTYIFYLDTEDCPIKYEE